MEEALVSLLKEKKSDLSVHLGGCEEDASALISEAQIVLHDPRHAQYLEMYQRREHHTLIVGILWVV